VHTAVLALCDVTQVLQVAGAIDICEEAGLSIIAALHDVLRKAGEVDAGLAGHGRVLAMVGSTVLGGSSQGDPARERGGVGKVRADCRFFSPEVEKVEPDPGFVQADAPGLYPRGG